MEAKALAPEPISSYSVLLSPCLPSLFAAHLRQIHPFVCQAMCFESFSACYWFSSPSSFSLFYIFFSIKHWFEFSTSTFSLLSLSRSLIISRLHQAFISHLCTFFLFISFFLLALSISRLCFLFFFLSGRYCGWWSTVWRHFSLSVCMFVCLGKDMLLTLWLSSTWKNANFLRQNFQCSQKPNFESTLMYFWKVFWYVGSVLRQCRWLILQMPMTNLFEIPAIHTLQQLISVMNATCLVECVLISESAGVLIFG